MQRIPEFWLVMTEYDFKVEDPVDNLGTGDPKFTWQAAWSAYGDAMRDGYHSQVLVIRPDHTWYDVTGAAVDSARDWYLEHGLELPEWLAFLLV